MVDLIRHNRSDPLFADVELAAQPSEREYQRLYPKEMRGGVQANLLCKLSKASALEKCKILEIDPASTAAKEYILALSSQFKLATEPLGQRAKLIEAVRLYISIDDQSRDGHHPCLNPFCVATMPPPPPPRGMPGAAGTNS